VLWHDTAARNPNVKRYVQPTKGDPNYNKLIQIIGKNNNANDWNHVKVNKGVNAMIGKLADGSIGTVQTGDWLMAPWGCDCGARGSCNGYIMVAGQVVYQGKHWLQIEICDDGYKDKAYFEAVYKEACEFTAYICKLYNINPYGTVNFNGVTAPTILCHQDAYQLKLGNNHGDVYQWFKAMGMAQNMDKVRADVAALMNVKKEKPKMNIFNLGDMVKIKPEVKTYYNGTVMPDWVKKSTLYGRDLKTEGRVVISTQQSGDITGTVYAKDLELVGEKPIAKEPAKKAEKPFKEVEASSKEKVTSTVKPPVVSDNKVAANDKDDGSFLKELIDLLIEFFKK
jgi:hypothetical protein